MHLRTVRRWVQQNYNLLPRKAYFRIGGCRRVYIATATCGNKTGVVGLLTISVLQASTPICSTLTTDYGIPSDFARKSTASLQIKISTAQLNFSNRNVIIF